MWIITHSPSPFSLCVSLSNMCLISLSVVMDRNVVASCKDSIGWMFSKLDTNSDLYLDQAELAAINLDKYEVCIRPFFNSCDSYRDGKVSTAEWCLCFWRQSEYTVGRGVCVCEGVTECVSLWVGVCETVRSAPLPGNSVSGESEYGGYCVCRWGVECVCVRVQLCVFFM